MMDKREKNWVQFIRDLPATAPGKRRYEAFLKGEGPRQDLDFLRLIARELYTDTTAIFEELDPQRLIFGERYNTFYVPREVLEEAAKVVDVISVQPFRFYNYRRFDISGEEVIMRSCDSICWILPFAPGFPFNLSRLTMRGPRDA